MITSATTRRDSDASSVVEMARHAGARFETVMVLLSGWVLGGAYLDGWAHRHIGRLETFLTPWHAILYSGVLATGAFLFVHLMRGRDTGRSWRTALPRGYGIAFLGFCLFGIGGTLDLGWHTIFGIERSYAASISPTHLLLMASAALMVSGGLRAAWLSGTTRLGYAGLLSATALLAVFIFFSQDLHPFTSQWSAAGFVPLGFKDQWEELGVTEIILQSAILMGVILFLLGRFSLPRGALTIMLTLTTTAVVVIWQLDPIVFIGVLGGLIGDLLIAALRPSPARPLAVRSFAALLPAALYLLYFLGILKVDGIWWPFHVWTGAIVIAGVTGLLISYLAVPPTPTLPLRGGRISALGG